MEKSSAHTQGFTESLYTKHVILPTPVNAAQLNTYGAMKTASVVLNVVKYAT
ncbi:hypothetical protein PGT21_010125 [Puccinia graminis f. sp. tritici]|uniref:Uncharacterized protein n=1 Tax=Puccinia graminis f. sp. tritici TaxID=56615 RepID=A0A5B0SFD2_PUCGR|nr:hypothetical protein PGT21_010125 [Puccinia graminis f. sp. tritici]KAA1135943.1 hypothetical protein PGTUg99_006366 [Puccinia graminis f. sp. tritici]